MSSENVNESIRHGDQGAVVGESEHAQHRAGPGEGVRAPWAEGDADHTEFSIFDGKGNESVAVVTNDDEGVPAQGTGPSTEEAMADAKKPGDPLGKGFSPSEHY